MTDIDVVALRAAAEGATPGPWVCAEQTHGEWYGIQSQQFALGNVFLAKDGVHIAAANPAVLLELLDRLAAAEGAVEEVRRAFDPGELGCGRIGMSCRDVHTPDRWCRACRIANALDPKEQP